MEEASFQVERSRADRTARSLLAVIHAGIVPKQYDLEARLTSKHYMSIDTSKQLPRAPLNYLSKITDGACLSHVPLFDQVSITDTEGMGMRG
jgi:hypothetical protein